MQDPSATSSVRKNDFEAFNTGLQGYLQDQNEYEVRDKSMFGQLIDTFYRVA
jgi:hypothetical protein